MMGLRKKWNDQSGASILLALLFFLLCAMVGASILAAAASNAGKARSNREEQQKYLLLSSALRLVCGELTSAKYIGAYTLEVKEIKNVDGLVAYSYAEYVQTTGAFTCALNDGVSTPVLPLCPELDYIFAKTFLPSGSGTYQGDDVYTPLTSGTSAPAAHALTVTVDTSAAEGLDGLKDGVTVTVKLDENYSIRLTAKLGEYTMEAYLTPSGTTPDVKNSMKGPITWTLAWISK